MKTVNRLGRSACNRNESSPPQKNHLMIVQNLTSCHRLITRYLQLFSLTSSGRTFKHSTASTLATTTTLPNSGHQFTPTAALTKNQGRRKQQHTLQQHNHYLARKDSSNVLRSEYSHMQICLKTK